VPRPAPRPRDYHRRVRIDLNADVGESFGAWRIGEDERLIPLVTAINVACGFHAGDPLVIERTVRLGVDAGVAIGAHPGYADLPGFGRRDIEMPLDELEASVVYQVAAVAGFAAAAGVALRHVKPHGALYNRSARDAAVAAAIARGVRRVSADLVLVGLAGSLSLTAARDAGLPVAAEAFADRAYEPDGTLRSRRLEGSMLSDPDAAARQAVSIARDRRVTAIDGSVVPVEADTICVHGDEAGAADRAAAVREALEAAGIRVAALAP
jgi:5-oxoprolinase (ATP-hydrolysing) subunit A